MSKYFNNLDDAINAVKLAKEGDNSLLEAAPINKLFHDFRVEKETIHGATDVSDYTVYKGKYNIMYKS